MDKSCVQEFPVDCIYEGGRSLHINPDECVDCRACKLICRVEAIYYETGPPPEELVLAPTTPGSSTKRCLVARGRSERQVAPLQSAGWVSTRPWSPARPRAESRHPSA